jgi:hypothetical protein
MAFSFSGFLKGILIQNEVDRTKQVAIQSSSSATTGTTTTILAAQTSNQTLTIPDTGTSDTLTANAATQTLTNKTISGASNTLSNIPSTALNTVQITQGGTGQTTQQAALNALAGATTSAEFLRGNGTNVTMSAIQASDVPTLNQNTTGTAASLSGGVEGDIPYQSTANTTAFLTPGVSGQVLTTQGASAAPIWTSPLVNPMNAAGQMIYGGSGGTPTPVPAGTSGQILTSLGSTVAWETKTPTQTILNNPNAGSTTYWVFPVVSANATIGAVYLNTNGSTLHNYYTVLGTISGGSYLFCQLTSATNPGAFYGTTLTKQSGTGDSSITFITQIQELAIYTPPTGVTKLKVVAVGPGGGGGGIQGLNSSGYAGGSYGGGGGGTTIKWISSPLSSYYYSVGSGGSGGAAGTNAGSNGTNTYFDINSLIATGGGGGQPVTANNGLPTTFATAGVGGIGMGGDINIQGSTGGYSFQTAQLSYGIVSGSGGASFLQTEIPGVHPGGINAVAGNNGQLGAGGSGAGVGQTASAVAGGNGGNGIIIVEEFYT